MKKVITGHDGQGKSVFFKVESETVTVGSPIVDWHEIWAVSYTHLTLPTTPYV